MSIPDWIGAPATMGMAGRRFFGFVISGWAAASTVCAHLVRSVEDADSWSTDAHKSLNVPYDSAWPSSETRCAEASYVVGGGVFATGRAPRANRNTHRSLPGGARRRSLGRAPLAGPVGPKRPHRADLSPGCPFRKRSAARGCEILNELMLNQVRVSFGYPARTRQVIGRVPRDAATGTRSRVH